MDKEEKTKKIDFVFIAKRIWQNKKTYAIVLPIVFVLSCLIILCVPRTYSTETRVVPELDNSKSGGALSSIASSFGFDLSSVQTSDAITPLLYPDLMEDNKFVAELFNMRVQSADGAIDTTLYYYLALYNESPWWTKASIAVRKFFSSKKVAKGSAKFDPYYLSKLNDDIMGMVRKDIGISVDKKTGVISIAAQAQDPLICKTMADSTRSLIQRYITEYRTNKARVDLNYYKKLAIEAKDDYERARQKYSSYSDANMDVMLTSFKSKTEDLENEMQLKYNVYSTMSTQYQDAKARVQERTPAFTVIKGASVPIKPTGPKRMIFVLGMTMMAFFVLSLWFIRDCLLKD